MILDPLADAEDAERLENAVATVIREGKVGTCDVKGRGPGNSTLEVARDVVGNV